MIGLFQVGIAMIIEKNDKILIGRRSDTKDFGASLWEFPSGRLDKGETPEEAIKREGMEELAIEIKPLEIIDSYGFKRNEYDMILLTYICEYEGSIQRSKEHDKLEWVKPEIARERFSFPQQKGTVDKYLQRL